MLNLTPDAKFRITLGSGVVAACTLFVFGWNAQKTLTSINENLKNTNQRLDGVESKMNERISGFETTIQDRWTKTAAAEWALRMLVSNPTIKIPDPRDPSKLLGGWE